MADRSVRIGIIGGTGKEGLSLATRWVRAGHDVLIGSRDAGRGREAATRITGPGKIAGASNEDAARHGEVVVLCVPYAAHASTLMDLREALSGKILVDITVPLKPPKVRRVNLPAGGAAALEARTILGGETRVVATLHHVSSVHLEDMDHPIDCDILVCGDDVAAREQVASLLEDLPARALHAGPLDNAVALEALTPVLLFINKRYGVPGAGVRFTGLDR